MGCFDIIVPLIVLGFNQLSNKVYVGLELSWRTPIPNKWYQSQVRSAVQWCRLLDGGGRFGQKDNGLEILDAETKSRLWWCW